MSKCLAFVAAACICVELLAVPAHAGQMAEEKHGEPHTLDYGKVQRFATLPQMGVAGAALGHPEGLCADRRGNIYADTFELPTANGYVQNYIYAFGSGGNLLSATPTPTGVVPLGCIVSGKKFYMNDVINGNELEYSLPLSESSQPDRSSSCVQVTFLAIPTSVQSTPIMLARMVASMFPTTARP